MNSLRRILMNISKPKFNKITYNNQYETRDSIIKNEIRNNNLNDIINYDKTEAFENYKPNLKSYYEN